MQGFVAKSSHTSQMMAISGMDTTSSGLYCKHNTIVNYDRRWHHNYKYDDCNWRLLTTIIDASRVMLQIVVSLHHLIMIVIYNCNSYSTGHWVVLWA